MPVHRIPDYTTPGYSTRWVHRPIGWDLWYTTNVLVHQVEPKDSVGRPPQPGDPNYHPPAEGQDPITGTAVGASNALIAANHFVDLSAPVDDGLVQFVDLLHGNKWPEGNGTADLVKIKLGEGTFEIQGFEPEIDRLTFEAPSTKQTYTVTNKKGKIKTKTRLVEAGPVDYSFNYGGGYGSTDVEIFANGKRVGSMMLAGGSVTDQLWGQLQSAVI